MKKGIVFAAALLMCSGLSAQTLKVHRGQVAVAVDTEGLQEMRYTDGGTAIEIAGMTYNVADVDSIVMTEEAYRPLSVDVRYDDEQAWLTVSADVAPMLSVDVQQADVTVMADSLLQQELTYTLAGTSADGSFFMDGEYKTTICLDGLTLTNTRGAAINIANGKRINVVLNDGTVTTLTDGTGGTHKACFFVNGHPEFSGAGELRLTGNTKHAFASDEYTQLKAGFGTIKVLSAVGDGLHVEQYFHMLGGTVDIAGVKGDGIDVSITKDPLDALNGQVIIEGGSITLDVAADDTKGLKCDSAMTISGGTITAEVTGNGTKGISVGTDLLIQQKTNVATAVSMNVTGTTYMPGDADLESKCRGIKVKGNFVFDGGRIEISATGAKSKAISVDGTYTYKSGAINCFVDANG